MLLSSEWEGGHTIARAERSTPPPHSPFPTFALSAKANYVDEMLTGNDANSGTGENMFCSSRSPCRKKLLYSPG